MTTPLRPSQADLDRVGSDVEPISAMQDRIVENHPQLTQRDRLAHQYQIAGGKVLFRVAQQLPKNLVGVGLFEPGAQHVGIGRLSTGLGCPHLETDPDFLGLMVAFQTRGGQRVDFVTINDPAAPTDTHRQFVRLLDATVQAAGVEPPFGSGLGELDLPNLLVSNLRLTASLVSESSLGLLQGGRIALHVLQQTLRTAKSSTAYQTYWTGIVEAGGVLGKFLFVPETDENRARALTPGERHLTTEWRERQARGGIAFTLHWLPFVSEEATSTTVLTKPWEQRPELVGHIVFPRTDADSGEARLWAALAAEMGANQGNWVADTQNSIAEPATEFTLARKLAYRRSQVGRNALPEAAYAHVFRGEDIGTALAAELRQRRDAKRAAGHMDMAPL